MNFLLPVVVFFALIFDKLNIFLYTLIAAFCHEMGHLFACICLGITPKIQASIFGLRLKNYPNQKNKKLFILIAGPLVNFLLVIGSFYRIEYHFSLNWYVFMCVNLVIMIFNLMPFNFLDGGQIIGLFFSNSLLRKILDLCALGGALCLLFYFSANIYYSIGSFCIFLIYYIINRLSLI